MSSISCKRMPWTAKSKSRRGCSAGESERDDLAQAHETGAKCVSDFAPPFAARA